MYLTLALMVACHKNDKPKDDSGTIPNESQPDSGTTNTDDSSMDDTGTTHDTDTAPPCTALVLETTPVEGEMAWYQRDPLQVLFDSDGSQATVTLTDGTGATVPMLSTWGDGNVSLSLSNLLVPATDYTLTVDLCGVQTQTHFRTSDLGLPLQVVPEDLVGRTWEFRFSDNATITEPGFLDVLASSYLSVPILIGVEYADATSIDLIGALGDQYPSGLYYQSTVEDPWDFPLGDFSQSPFFSSTAALATLTYDGVPIPIEQFHLEGTFTADASQIQKGVATGLVDTRDAGVWVNDPGNPDAVCNLAKLAGNIDCLECADGMPYCLFIRAEDITATYVEGLTIQP